MEEKILTSPPLENLIQAGRRLIEEFEPKKLVYLDSKGKWKNNPETIRNRISSEFLFYLWKLGAEKQSSFIRDAFPQFLKGDSWFVTKKIAWALSSDSGSNPANLTEKEIDRALIQTYSLSGRPKKTYPLLIILSVLWWILEYESFRINSHIFVPVWDEEANTLRQEYEQHLHSMNDLMNAVSMGKEAERYISEILKRLHASSADVIQLIPQTIAEEDRLIKAIDRLLVKARDPEKREEIFPFIIEKIQPPMGIVEHTSPALLRPCLQLLMEDQIEIESGVQYNASVILSILQDPRSTETLLKALERFPLQYSKIRVNIIYTLGNLRESEAVKFITHVLKGPDEAIFSVHGEKKVFPLIEQKEEAIQALARIGLESLQSIPTLIKYAEHPSAKLKTYLAWALGEIGKSQKEKYRGVSADIIITLLQLLKNKNKKIFEESVSSLKKIDMPEFIHSLYLYNVGAVSILGLKPSQKGLYELSETLHFFIQTKKRVVMAVNGDSGTGKTYFCQSIINGFGEVRPEEILYLMRDRKKDQKIFNRILGLRWLKKYIDPIYYHDYPLSVEEDNPEEFLNQFLEENSDKKIIILDGCRDRYYFQRIIDLFYFRGKLDAVVNFRATFSTRRLNLEEREIALESVKTHLSFLEEPTFEDTLFYREGNTVLYDLDNSLSCRLNSQETQELFEKRRIDSWGDLIRIGDFKEEAVPLKVEDETISIQQENFSLKEEALPKTRTRAFDHGERKFRLDLNEHLASQPNLLGSIGMNDLKPKQIRPYAQDQIAGIGEEGGVFVLTFLDNRIFFTFMEKIREMTLLGRNIFLLNYKGEFINISFESNETLRLKKMVSPALVCSSFSTDKVITGHGEGSIRIWDFLGKTVRLLKGHRQEVTALAVDYFGRIYSASTDRSLKQWDVEQAVVNTVKDFDGKITHLKLYPNGKILALTETDTRDTYKRKTKNYMIRIFDFKKQHTRIIPLPFTEMITGVNVYFDGRIILSIAPSGSKTDKDGKSLAIISPGENLWGYKILKAHHIKTNDCQTMGPKIITCGQEATGEHTIRVWGTEYFVKTELGKLSLQPS